MSKKPQPVMTAILEQKPACDEVPFRRRHAELRGSVDGITWTPWCFHCWLPWDGGQASIPWLTGKERYIQVRIVEGDEVVRTSPVIVWDEQWWGVA